jgi:hypothetical protein
VLRFLSSEWLQAYDDALRSEPDLGGRFAECPIAIAQEVSDGRGDGTVRYVVVLDASGGRLEAGDAAAGADVTFVCDRETAAQLAQGSINAQRALTSGRLKLRGGVDRLAAASAALVAMGDVMESVRMNTEF